MKKKWYLPALFGVVWILLLLLLVYVESFSDEAMICTIADAIWFAVVTLTTVGYGDLYPVTMLGRLIGILLVLLSTGFVTFLIGTVISAMLGQVWPRLRLRMLRRRRWFVFDEQSVETTVLAENLRKENPDAIFVFSVKESEKKWVLWGGRYFYIAATVQEIVKLRKDGGRDCKLFLMCAEAKMHRCGMEDFLGEVYLQTEHAPNRVPKGTILFNRYDCCARMYWRREALSGTEKKIVLIGDGKYGEKLLERALLCNVFSKEQALEYHVFGEFTNFLYNHHQLKNVVNIDGDGEKWDNVYFHKEPWNADGKLLEAADRIIICGDNEADNLEILSCLKCYFVTDAGIHVRCEGKPEEAVTFGSIAEIYVPELVMGTELNRIAVMMHEIYRASVEGEVATWEEIGEFARQSNIAAAEHLLIKLRILLEEEDISAVTRKDCERAYERYRETFDRCSYYREIEHERWARFHFMHNWSYGTERQNEKRKHPMLVEFEQLPLREQEKDDYAWELLGAVAEQL